MLQVKGQRMDVNSKIRTRARAKEQAEQWQMVPLPAKLIALLADSVSESAGTLPTNVLEYVHCINCAHASHHTATASGNQVMPPEP